jgi:glycosyltransferase involved in cell wall biosynthesis
MRKLSAVIITFNEARNIKRCIASLQDVADEVVVIDSFSTDATPSICKGLNVQFHQREWKGYSKQKNYGKGYNYSFNRLTNYCGKWIKHSGWYPDTKVKMFNRSEDDWQGEVHETLTVDSNAVKRLKGDLLHYSYNSVSDHVNRTDVYSTLGAKELFEKGKKASLVKLLFNPWLKFNKMYFIKLGFLDGMAGFTIALITAYGTFLKYIKLYYLVKNAN